MPAGADVRTVGEGVGSPLGYMVRTARTVLSGERSPNAVARDVAFNQGFYSEAFAQIAQSNPRAAMDAINTFNNWYSGPPTRARPMTGADRAPPKPGTYGGAVVGTVTLQSVLEWAQSNLGKAPGLPAGPATPPINPTPRPIPTNPINVTGGPNPGWSATEVWLAREREIWARAEAAAARGGGSLPRVLGGAVAVIGGALWPSSITPEVPIQPTAPGPTTRGGARRPAGPAPGSGPIKSPTGTVTVNPGYTGPVGDISALPTPQTPVEIATGPVSVTTPTVSSGPGVSTSSITSAIQSIAPYILPFILPSGSSGSSSRSKRWTDPLSPSWPSGNYDPLTPFNPGMSGYPQTSTGGSVGPGQSNDRCNCQQQRNRKKKRSKRTVCYQGTYTEKASGLTKRKKRKVPCK